jgi:tight adherence protein B
VSELLVVFLLVFAVALILIRTGAASLLHAYQARAAVHRRLSDTKHILSSQHAVGAMRGLRGIANFDNKILRRANDFLVQSGLKITRSRLAFLLIGALALWFAVSLIAVGPGLQSVFVAPAAAVLSLIVYFRAARRRRIARFAALLPDTIDIIVRGLRVGYPLPAALNLVAHEMPEPIGSEFRLTCEEIEFGLDLRSAIENLYSRVGQEDLLFLVMAINVQNQTGGNLAQILSGLARLLRNRSKLALKVKALSADGRMSAMVLSLFPFILVGGINFISPAYFSEVRQHAAIIPALVYAGISLLIGNIVMYRMVNFKF